MSPMGFGEIIPPGTETVSGTTGASSRTPSPSASSAKADSCKHIRKQRESTSGTLNKRVQNHTENNVLKPDSTGATRKKITSARTVAVRRLGSRSS